MQKTSTGVIALTNKTDYYPFGMPMPNRQTTDGNYRYAFQGQEKDPETGMETFELRLWDGRLGRWLTVDPYHEFHSPYVGMGNEPISLIDPDGGSTGGGQSGDPDPIKQLFGPTECNHGGWGSVKESMTASVSGFGNAFGSNFLLGLGRMSPDDWSNEATRKNFFHAQVLGDAISIPVGFLEAGAGLLVDAGSFAFAPITGGASTVFIPAGSFAVGQGLSGVILGGLNLARDIQYFHSMDDVHPTEGSSGSGEGIQKPKPRSFEKRIGKRVKLPSRKSAYEAAKRAGGGHEPELHFDGEHGPHFHPRNPKWKKTDVRLHDHYYFPN